MNEAGNDALSKSSITSHNIETQTKSDIPISKKRKRGTDAADLLSESFTVKPYPSTIQCKPRTLRPCALIDRASLPLSYLDATSSTNSLPPARLFEANIKILELENRIGDKPVILIARLDDGRTYYAIEHESKGLYAFCKLGSWVDIEALSTRAIHKIQLPFARKEVGTTKSVANQVLDTTKHVAPKPVKMSKEKRLAIEELQSMVKRSVTPSQLSISSSLVSEIPVEAALITPIHSDPSPAIQPHVLMDENHAVEQTSIDILENIRSQYLEALYLSKASLAYFAKGPLSRARAAFQADNDSKFDMKDLIDFLDMLALSSNLIDKKYKDALPAILTAIDSGGHSAHETGKENVPKKQRKKKMKLSRNGLYPTEEALVSRWWESHDSSMTPGLPDETQQDVYRRRLMHLRVRETQLQMMIILEALALQSSYNEQQPEESLQSNETPVIADIPSQKKKPRKLDGLIDMHIDRLCIWQSITEETNVALTGSAEDIRPTEPLPGQHKAADILKEFCTEVITPFFLARLPDRCVEISEKLGVSTAAAAMERPKLVRNSSSKLFAKPGAVATRRSAPSKDKPPRTLQRVLTDDRANRRSMSRASPSAISLMRSQTLPMVPLLKREGSETPSLSSIPQAKIRSMSAREVDFKDLANTTVPKNKKDVVDAQLRDAIEALKKPNRQLAGQSIMETAERRAIGALQSRKSKRPVHNPFFQGVQIQATPRTNRQKDMMLDSQHVSTESQTQSYYEDAVPSSSAQHVPQSVYRPRSQQQPDLSETPIRTTKYAVVDNTPVQRLSLSQRATSMPQASSPIQDRTALSQPIFLPSTTKLNLSRMSTNPDSMFAQVSETSNDIRVPVSPEIAFKSLGTTPTAESGNAGKLSQMVADADELYKSLGWD